MQAISAVLKKEPNGWAVTLDNGDVVEFWVPQGDWTAQQVVDLFNEPPPENDPALE